MTKAELFAENQALRAEKADFVAQIASLQNQLNAVLRLLKTGKGERYVPAAEDQLSLFAETTEVAPATPTSEPQTITYQRQAKSKKPHPGREPLPEHLERREEVLEPELDPNFEWKKISEERTQTLEFDPAHLYVRVLVRPVYKKVTQDPSAPTEIRTAELPWRPIPGSYATASLLAHIIIAKLVDHLPFYRQIQRFKRDQDLILHKNTLNGWFAAVCTLLEPLYEVMRQQVLSQTYLQADETWMMVLTHLATDKAGEKIKKKEKTNGAKDKKIQRGWMWVVHDPVHQHVLFNYEAGRTKQDARSLLADFKGYLQVDGYAAYSHLFKQCKVIHVACLTHIRRKFYNALTNDKKRAEQALGYIRTMYRLEDQARNLDADQRYEYRLKHLQPLLEEFKNWLDETGVQVTPKSPIGKAMIYAQNQWAGLKNVLLDGRLQIDNNLIENTIRPLALGRKNYLFAGSNKAAQRLAMMYSFLGTCKAQGVNPYLWLKKVLEVIPDTKLSELVNLLPGKLDLTEQADG